MPAKVVIAWVGVALSLGAGLYYANPALALLGTMAIRLITQVNPVPQSSKTSKLSLQTAIVMLGLTMGLGQLADVSATYGLAVAAFVIGTLLIGGLLAMMLRIRSAETDLLSSGTAICGGTAIATLSPLIGARSEQVGVAMALVFLLNAVALFTFPAIGQALNLSQAEFGAWVALAVHDTSSVVATAALYGPEAQEVATTVKLGRTLWLIPLAFVASIAYRRDSAQLRIPTFVLLFVAAAGIASLVSLPAELVGWIKLISKGLLVLALALIGLDISRDTLKGLSFKSVAFGLGLWLLAIPASLYLVLNPL